MLRGGGILSPGGIFQGGIFKQGGNFLVGGGIFCSICGRVFCGEICFRGNFPVTVNNILSPFNGVQDIYDTDKFLSLSYV